MCIRYQKGQNQLIRWSEQIEAWLALEDWAEGEDTFPGTLAPVVAPDLEHGRAMISAQWGIVPPWAKDASFGKKNAYNARAETLLEKPTFRAAFKKRRCVVPATAFFERKLGRWIRFAAVGGVLPLAGLYEAANALCNVPSFALVTTDPNEVVSEVQDRMPVVLAAEDLLRWLDPETDLGELRRLLGPCPPDWMTAEDAGPIGKKIAKDKSLFDEWEPC
jgi:putative SOS response-associated peptidase YedK